MALLAVVACVPSVALGVWTVSVEKIAIPVKRMVQVAKEHRAPTDYSASRDILRSFEGSLFSNVPAEGPVRWYDVLGIPENANRAAIRKKHAQLSLATHPDKDAHANGDAFQAVNDAKDEALKLPQNMPDDTPDDLRYYEEVWDGEYDLMETEDYGVKWNGVFFTPAQPGYVNQYSGSGFVPEANNLDDIFGSDKAADFDALNPLATESKQFYIKKLVLCAAVALGNNYFKKRKKMKLLIARWKRFKENHPNIATVLQLSGRGGFIALASLYPLYKFRKIFSMGYADSEHKSKKIPGDALDADDLEVFYQRVVIGRTYHQNGSSPIYDEGAPIGYMTKDNARKAFVPIRKAKAMSAITAAASMASAWMGCVL